MTAAIVNSGHTTRSLARHLKIDARTLARLEAREAVHPSKAKVVADFFEVQVTDLMPIQPSGKAAEAA